MTNLLFKVWRNTTIILFSFLSIITFTVYYGNLFDRVTINLLRNSSSFFQSLGGLGWILSIITSCVIIIGSFDYWISISPNNNYDLIIAMILIYLFVGFTIGKTMKGLPNYSGFLLGFFSMIYINYTMYGIIYGLSSAIDQGYIIFAVIKGFYGMDNIHAYLIKGALINGAVLGVFGFFFTSVYNSMGKSKSPMYVGKVKKCAPSTNYCVHVNKKSKANKPIVFKKF